MRHLPVLLTSFAGVMATTVSAAAQDSPVTRTAASRCARLATLALPDVRITAATATAAGERIARRGKLLLRHGWSDPALNALETIRSHDLVATRNPATRDAMRLFLLPGVQPCGGAGPDRVDWLAALAKWVEQGQAPETRVAATIEKGATVRTRPVCAYPQRAVYRGSGSTDEAAQFVCRSQ